MDKKGFVKHLPIQDRQVFHQKTIWLHRTLHIYFINNNSIRSMGSKANVSGEETGADARKPLSILCCVFVLLLLLLVYSILPVSQSCPFLLPLRYSVTFISMHVFSDLFIGFWNCFYDLFVFCFCFFFLLFIFFMTEFSVYLKKKLLAIMYPQSPWVSCSRILLNYLTFKWFDFECRLRIPETQSQH